MAEKRPAETSTEEPASKKQALTPEMYEELKAKIAELEKRDTEAQKMTQEMIEKLQDRTAVSEEKFEKVKKLISKLNEHKKDLEMWIYVLKTRLNLIPCLNLDDLPKTKQNKIRKDLRNILGHLQRDFTEKITIAIENRKSVEDEINQLMD